MGQVNIPYNNPRYGRSRNVLSEGPVESDEAIIRAAAKEADRGTTSPMEYAFQRMAQKTDLLHERLDILAESIDPILISPSNDRSETDDLMDVENVEQSQLVRMMHHRTRDLEVILAKVNELITRVDL